MNKPTSTPGGARPRDGEASGKHEGLHHPIDENERGKQRLGEVGTRGQADAAEDEMRDRRSSGARPEDRSGEPGGRRH